MMSDAPKPQPQPTVTRGTAISGALGAGASVSISAEAVLWMLPKSYEEMPVTLAATIGMLGAGAIGTIITAIYWGLASIPWDGNPFRSRTMFQPKKDEQ